MAKQKEKEIFDSAPQQNFSLGGGGGGGLPSLGGGMLPAMGAPKSTGLALFDEIEIKENDTAEEVEHK